MVQLKMLSLKCLGCEMYVRKRKKIRLRKALELLIWADSVVNASAASPSLTTDNERRPPASRATEATVWPLLRKWGRRHLP